MSQKILIILLIFTSLTSYAQIFEGSITYKIEAINPSPQLIPDSIWQEGLKEQFGEKGIMLQKYFYKEGNYISEIEVGKVNGFQAYNPKDGLLYTWQENSDTAITVNTKFSMDELVEIIDSKQTDTIMGIPCKSIIVKSKLGEMSLWYNKEYFKMTPEFYKGHKYGHYEQILKKIGCLPLKMEQNGFMSHIIQTAIDYKEMKVEQTKFAIPQFKEIIENPVN